MILVNDEDLSTCGWLKCESLWLAVVVQQLSQVHVLPPPYPFHELGREWWESLIDNCQSATACGGLQVVIGN